MSGPSQSCCLDVGKGDELGREILTVVDMAAEGLDSPKLYLARETARMGSWTGMFRFPPSSSNEEPASATQCPPFVHGP